MYIMFIRSPLYNRLIDPNIENVLKYQYPSAFHIKHPCLPKISKMIVMLSKFGTHLCKNKLDKMFFFEESWPINIHFLPVHTSSTCVATWLFSLFFDSLINLMIMRLEGLNNSGYPIAAVDTLSDDEFSLLSRNTERRLLQSTIVVFLKNCDCWDYDYWDLGILNDSHNLESDFCFFSSCHKTYSHKLFLLSTVCYSLSSKITSLDFLCMFHKCNEIIFIWYCIRIWFLWISRDSISSWYEHRYSFLWL